MKNALTRRSVLMPMADHMAMQVPVKNTIVMMVVLVDEIGFQQQFLVTQDFGPRTVCDQLVVLIQDQDSLCDFIHDTQIMSSSDDCLPGLP
jgi:hypothetical protein